MRQAGHSAASADLEMRRRRVEQISSSVDTPQVLEASAFSFASEKVGSPPRSWMPSVEEECEKSTQFLPGRSRPRA